MSEQCTDFVDRDNLHTLARELRIVVGRVKRRLQEQSGIGDLTHSQISVLLHLEKVGSSTITDLAKIEGIRSQSMGSTVSGLEVINLVKGSADPNDRRRTIYSLTELCRNLIDRGRAIRQDWLTSRISEKLSEEEQKTLMSAIELINRLIE